MLPVLQTLTSRVDLGGCPASLTSLWDLSTKASGSAKPPPCLVRLTSLLRLVLALTAAVRHLGVQCLLGSNDNISEDSCMWHSAVMHGVCHLLLLSKGLRSFQELPFS